jgi:hypothetical protein
MQASRTTLEKERRTTRLNEARKVDVVRIKVAAAGDMAYEFSNFRIDYDDPQTKQRTGFNGSLLRVCEKSAASGWWKHRSHDPTKIPPR